MTSTKQWSPQQVKALADVKDWFDNRSEEQQVYKLFGYAGTGKTTLALELAQSLSDTPLFAAYTGKAARVMQTKGCRNARTIHSLIYKCTTPPGAPPKFALNDESPLVGADLVVIDECSMVGAELGKDLLSFGVPVLVLGDPAQLPPVKDAGFFITGEPDTMLTEIHRQALDNPIIRLSMDIRERGRRPSPGWYGESEIVFRNDLGMSTRLRDADQVLCGLNTTRYKLNYEMRSSLGFGHGNIPQPDDKLICLRNNQKKGLLNGGMWQAETVVFDSKDKLYTIEVQSLDDDEETNQVTVPEEFFLGKEDTIQPFKKRVKNDEFYFGYAITCHKSQGSQWPWVVVMDESVKFRQDAMKWLYTAVTRASERVTIVI